VSEASPISTSRFQSLGSLLKETGFDVSAAPLIGQIAQVALATSFAASSMKKLTLAAAAFTLSMGNAMAVEPATFNAALSDVQSSVQNAMQTATQDSAHLVEVDISTDFSKSNSPASVENQAQEVPDFVVQHFKFMANKYAKGVLPDGLRFNVVTEKVIESDTPLFAETDSKFCKIGLNTAPGAAKFWNEKILTNGDFDLETVELGILHELGHCLLASDPRTKDMQVSRRHDEVFADMFMVSMAQSQDHLKNSAALKHVLNLRAELAPPGSGKTHDTLGEVERFKANLDANESAKGTAFKAMFADSSDPRVLLFKEFKNLAQKNPLKFWLNEQFGGKANGLKLSSFATQGESFGRLHSLTDAVSQIKSEAQYGLQVTANKVKAVEHCAGHHHKHSPAQSMRF
jgi:hypothetical protein